MINEECQVCGKELTGTFVWVKCTYWQYHPVSECGGCMYPVGMGCIKKIPKKYHVRKTNMDEWIDEQEQMNEERDSNA